MESIDNNILLHILDFLDVESQLRLKATSKILYYSFDIDHEKYVQSYKSIPKAIKEAVINDQTNLISYIAKHYKQHIRYIFAYACRYNKETVVYQYYAAEYVDWGLWCACRGGHEPLARLMKEWGAINFDTGLYYACLGGHEPLVRLMKEYGATNFLEVLIQANEYNQTHLIPILEQWIAEQHI